MHNTVAQAIEVEGNCIKRSKRDIHTLYRAGIVLPEEVLENVRLCTNWAGDVLAFPNGNGTVDPRRLVCTMAKALGKGKKSKEYDGTITVVFTVKEFGPEFKVYLREYAPPSCHRVKLTREIPAKTEQTEVWICGDKDLQSKLAQGYTVVE